MPKANPSKVNTIKSKPKKVATKKPKLKIDSAKVKIRKIRLPVYKSFRISKTIRQPKPPIKNVFKLFITSSKFLLSKWKLFGGIVLLYLILTVVLVKGFGVASNLEGLRDTTQGLFHGNAAGLATSLTLFGFLLGNVNSTPSEVAGAYQSIVLIIISLVLIWALRQSMAAKTTKVTIRDAFYTATYPLIPFLLVLIVIGLQFIPLLVSSFLYSIVFGSGLAVTAIEKGLWALLLFIMAILSLYMVTSSVFALYIVTLPGVKPMQALKSARDLVRHRRWEIMRKVLFLPFALLLLAVLIIIPVIFLSPVVAEWLFLVLSMAALAVGHSYMYHLYRELL